ncbi:YqhR family membrane protein [Metabacillus iocasae]|uniref:Zn-dependent protease with chaperone function n=1 Tax=Priestia iocasae TaxID=2291674 RepID=A0ABS2QSR1_9BACI|nr:YqhR family membrane protein [Metabacillus iocasae]MBM7701569.1 Zn-dependent protease with chaperone function [Metabacillus iocasae]
MADQTKESNEMSQQQNKGNEEASFLAKTAIIGLVGGILWSFVGYLSYLFNFSEVSPSMILQPWVLGAWKETWIGTVVSILLLGVLSIVVALLYYAVLKRFKSMWVGIGYGLLLWALVFFVLNPIFPNVKSIWELEVNTIISTVCVYILYGVFVGYSISFEAAEIETKSHSSNA